MKKDDVQKSRDLAEEGRHKAYRPPRITEWGSILDLTRGTLGGYQDATYGGSDPFFRRPPRG